MIADRIHRCTSLVASLPLIAVAAALAQPPQRATVVVSPVIQREVTTGRTFVGTVLPSRKAEIGTAVDGRVIEVLFEEGDRVKALQPLVKLLTDTVQLELEAAQAELDFRMQQLAELENGTRPAEIEGAKAKMLGAAARKEFLAARRARVEKLYTSQAAASEESRDEAISAAIAAEQAYEEAKAQHDLAVEGARKEQIAQARAQVHMQQALVSKLVDQKQKHTMVSRFDGYVTAKRTELGKWVTKGDAVVEVLALDTVEINAYVPEADIPYVRIGEDVHVVIPALPNALFSGRVALVIPDADARSRTFPVKVRVENPPGSDGPLLKAGMSARVTLPTGPIQNGMLVPKDALVLGGPQPTVFVVDAASEGSLDGKARPVAVSLGVPSGSWIQVTGSLKPGEKVVVRGNERLRPGQDVSIASELAPEAELVPPAVATPPPQ